MLLTGDLHNGATASHVTRRNLRPFQDSKILCTGDFGAVWSHDYHTNPKSKRSEDFFVDKTLSPSHLWLSVDGNHENFDRLHSEFENVELFGGRAIKVRKNIYYLQRGEVFVVDGLRIFAFGGATSHDKDPGYYTNTYGKCKRHNGRTKGVDWWPEETVTDAQIENAFHNLNHVNWEVDIILTHTCPVSVRHHFVLDTAPESFKTLVDPVEVQLQVFLEMGLVFKEWHFGHFHQNKTVDKFHCHFDQVTQLSITNDTN